MGEANLSVPFTAGVGVCNKHPSVAQGTASMPPKELGVGWAFSPQGTSPKGSPLCRGRPAVAARLTRMELNTTEVFGVCTAARFGVLTTNGVSWHGTTAPWSTPDNSFSYPAEQLEARKHCKVWSKELAFLPLCNASWGPAQVRQHFLLFIRWRQSWKLHLVSVNCPHCNSVLRGMNT